MTNTKTLIATVYSAFNERDIERALAFMGDTISWPKASEGGRVVGKEQIRAYWIRQWKEFDPHVEPIEVIDRGVECDVKVHQIVKSLSGDILSDGEVWHRFTIGEGLIERMDVGERGAVSEHGPSSAFSRH